MCRIPVGGEGYARHSRMRKSIEQKGTDLEIYGRGLGLGVTKGMTWNVRLEM